jgi:hypothetical protein
MLVVVSGMIAEAVLVFVSRTVSMLSCSIVELRPIERESHVLLAVP